MLVKNTRASVATVTVALITGVMVALWLALMPAPAQAQAGDSLRLLRLHVTNIEDAWPDNTDETHIVVDGRDVWNASVKEGQTIDLTGVPAQTLSGINARIDLMEHDTGHWPNDTDHLGSVFAEYTDGRERTETIRYNDGWAQYEITYRVERPRPVDTKPPETVISRGPEGSVSDNRATFEFHSDEPGSTFECKLGSGIWEQCSSPKVYTSLAVGAHTFSVKAKDPAGNVDPTPAQRSFSVVQNSLPTIDFVRPTGQIRDRTPLISATVKDAQTDLTQANIRLTVDGSAKSFAYNADADTLVYQSGRLAYGNHAVRIEATDAQGLTAARTWSFKVVKKR
jgi:hypothetical protein